jgi:hypothetical protein
MNHLQLLGALLLLLAAAASGCTTTIIPPPTPPDPATVYVTDYGRHSSLVLSGIDGRTSEYAFGDWHWFALGDTRFASALRAIFFSPASTLGRRQLEPIPPQADLAVAALGLGAERVLRLEVPQDRAEDLMRELDDLFDRHRDTATWSSASRMWFVRYDGDYWGGNNCNHVTAAWLRFLGCGIRGPATFSRFRITPPRAMDSDAPDDGAGHAGARLVR